MKTFKGAEVAPIDEMLERTHFVRALLAQLAEAQRLLDAANAELHDLRIRAGLGECDLFKHEWKETYYGYKCAKCDLFVPFGCEPWAPDESVIINCPQCGAEHVDMDGFGAIYCEACKYCVHPQTDGGVCGICGQEAN